MPLWDPEIAVDSVLASRLLAEQFPELAPLPIRLLGSGWDNTVYAVGEEWVCTYEGEISAEILRNALKWARKTRRNPRAKLDHLNWNRIAEQTLAAYRSVLNL